MVKCFYFLFIFKKILASNMSTFRYVVVTFTALTGVYYLSSSEK